MSIIRIKRSAATGSPTALAQGEMAYSFLGGTQSNGGDRLYMGTGTETGGIAANITVIGGKYFTDMLDHVPGTLTAGSALIVDSNSKLDNLFVDNININGNTIASTNINGDIILNPDGSGLIDVSGTRITNASDPTANSDVVTLNYLNTTFGTNLNIIGDSGTDTISLRSDSLTLNGGTGLTSIVSNNNITFNLDDTSVSAGSYGSATGVATFTVDAQGRLTAAGTTTISIPSTQVNDFVEAVQDTVATMVNGGSTQSGISVTYDDLNGKLNFNVNDPTITLSGDVNGSATMTDLASITITTTIQPNSVALGTDTTGDYVASLVAGTGVTLTNNSGETATPTITIGQDVATTANVIFRNGNFSGDVIIDGNLTIGGNTASINVTNLNVEDNMIYLNANNTVSNPDIGIAGNYNDGTYAHTGFFRDATDNRWKVFKGYTLEPDASSFIDTTHVSFALADIQADTFFGALSGNASTATALQTSRTIQLSGDVAGSVTFDGTANVNITATIQANSVALGTDTTGDYAGSVAVSGNGITITGTAGEGTAYTVNSSGTDVATPSTLVYRNTSGNFAANTVTAALVGNASTATALETARTIALGGALSGSASFDGTSNITITASPVADSIALGTHTVGNYIATIAATSGTGISVTGSGSETSAVTIAGIDATSSVKGVASFDSVNFSVSSGAVSIATIDGGTY